MNIFSKERSALLTASFLLGGFIFLYLSLFRLPAIPIPYLQGDSATYLFNASRMLHGQVIYRDFFQFTLPATEVFYLALFKIFGTRAWIPNVTLILLGLSTAYLMIVISRKVIPGKAAYLPAALFLVVPFRSHLDATHHWFSTLFAMAALAVLVQSITAVRLVGAGVLCGMAMCFTQSTGLPALLALGLFFLWAAATRQMSWINFRRAQLYLWSSFGIVVVVFNARFAFKAGLRTFLSQTVVFGLRYWHAEPWNRFSVYMTDMPVLHPWYRLPAFAIWASIYLLIPLIYILFFVRYRDEKTERTDVPWDRLLLVAFMGLMLFLGVAVAPSWMRLCCVAPPGVILFVWFMCSPGRFLRVRTTALWVIVILLAVGECGERWMGWQQVVKLPIGRVVMYNKIEYQMVEFLLKDTKPGDYFFGNNVLNYLLDLRDPSPIPYVTSSDYTRPEQVQQTIQSLGKYHVKYIYWSSNFDMAPAAGGDSNHVAPLRAYLLSHYQLVKSIDGDDCRRSFWENLSDVPPAPIPAPIPLPPLDQDQAYPPGSNGQYGPQAVPLDTPAQVP
jgi:hypothetical protein